jgi:hypothetical protein
MLKTGDTFERDGKTWRLIGIDKPKRGCFYLDNHCKSVVKNVCTDFSSHMYPIVEEVVPEWITPTDEDAKQRPECEVRDSDTEHWWTKRILLAVIDGSSPFVTIANSNPARWQQCRIRNPKHKD